MHMVVVKNCLKLLNERGALGLILQEMPPYFIILPLVILNCSMSVVYQYLLTYFCLFMYRLNSSQDSTFNMQFLSAMQLPVGASDPDLEERILQHLTAAAAMGRAHHFGRRESHRSRSAAHGRPHFFVFSAHPGSPPGPVAQGGETEPATLAGASPSTPLSSSGDDSSQHMLQFHPIQTNQNSSSASGSAAVQANRRGSSFNNR